MGNYSDGPAAWHRAQSTARRPHARACVRPHGRQPHSAAERRDGTQELLDAFCGSSLLILLSFTSGMGPWLLAHAWDVVSHRSGSTLRAGAAA